MNKIVNQEKTNLPKQHIGRLFYPLYSAWRNATKKNEEWEISTLSLHFTVCNGTVTGPLNNESASTYFPKQATGKKNAHTVHISCRNFTMLCPWGRRQAAYVEYLENFVFWNRFLLV